MRPKVGLNKEEEEIPQIQPLKMTKQYFHLAWQCQGSVTGSYWCFIYESYKLYGVGFEPVSSSETGSVATDEPF